MKQFKQPAQQALGWLPLWEKIFNLISIFCIAAIIVAVTSNVLMRYLFNSPIPGAFEASGALLVGVVFLSLAYVQATKGHTRVMFLVSRLPKGLQAQLNLITLVLALGVFIIMTWKGAVIAWGDFQVKEVAMGTVRFPVWPSKMLIPLGAGLLCLRLMVDIASQFSQLLKPDTKSTPGRGN